MKRIRQILFIFISLLILLISVIFYGITRSEPPKDLSKNTTFTLICGNAYSSGNLEKGKEMFNSNCAACHKLDAKSTGPALRNVDSLVFVKWMIRKNHKIDTTKIDQLGIDYHQITFNDIVNKENLPFLIDYCSGIRN